ncbi:MAG: hypothetical protein C0169_01145, partial [Thermodesulfobacterium geofontis]
MKKLVSFMLSLALVGMVGLTAGCKKKEEAPKEGAPKVETPAPAPQPSENVTAPEKAPEKPAEKPA